MSNPTYDSIVESIDAVTEDIEKLEKRLAKFEDCPPTTPRSRRRKARFEKRLAFKNDRLEYLNEQLEDFSPEAPDETQDQMKVEFWVDPITGENYGLGISITDTSLDDYYVGGTDLKIRVTGKGFRTPRGTRSWATTYGGLVSGEYAPIDDTATVGFGLRGNRLDGSYPDVTVTAFDADNNIVFSQLVYQDGVALI